MQIIGLAFLFVLAVVSVPVSVYGQVDQDLAQKYFREAAQLCEREGGKLWGVSLCGPMVIAQARTGTIATNEPAPEAPRPQSLGFANTAIDWGGTRWSTFVWEFLPAGDENKYLRGRLMLHELFHRIQPERGLFIATSPGENNHLETVNGRYWMQLEWQALARALNVYGATDRYRDQQKESVRDALTFREMRRRTFENSTETERISEINEGLAQYTGTIVAAGSLKNAAADTVLQLKAAPEKQSFVRTFSYPVGAAYGILLDLWSPGWTRRIGASDDLGQMVAEAMAVRPSNDIEAAAGRYGGANILLAEQRREKEHLARVAEYRHRFVETPQLVVPRGRGASFITTGVTPIPKVGTVYPQFRVSGPWGSLVADVVLMASDGRTYSLPATGPLEGSKLAGEGWKLTLKPGWEVRPGSRPGDFKIVPGDP